MRTAPLAAITLGLGAAWCVPGAAAHCQPLATLLGVDCRLPGLPGVALTFDDGPHPEGTPAVLDALARAGATATFFLVGEQVERHRSLAGELVAAGHEPAVHGYRHRNQMRLTPKRFATDLERAIDVIARACDRMPTYYRPPYGAFTPAGLRAVRQASLSPLLWSAWGRDWETGTSAARIETLVTSGIAAGAVVLLHDADWYCASGVYRHTVDALPGILAQLECRGLAAVGVGQADAAPTASWRLSSPTPR